MSDKQGDEKRMALQAQRAKLAQGATEHSYHGTGWIVAPRRSISCLRGIVSEGQSIGPLDYVHSRSEQEAQEGERRLREHVQKGLVIPDPKAKFDAKSDDGKGAKPNDDGKGAKPNDDGKGAKK